MQEPGPGDLSQEDLAGFADRFRDWIAAFSAELAPLLTVHSDYDTRVRDARAMRRLLCEHGWGRAGWPEAVGGLGGSILHRAVVTEELFRAGWTGPTVFEHLEIVAPTLVRFAEPDFAAAVLPSFLDGSRAWSQGFSEPEAGSDLAALRTRAVRDGEDYVVDGAKIWTSWSKWADWCLALVRTGTPEERHRGLTMIAIDLSSPGVEVRPIRQANGTDELAEVYFTDVRVPAGQVIGEVGRGWAVAMFLLAHERGTLSWLRHCAFRQWLTPSTKIMREDADRQLGDVVLQLAGVRAAAVELMQRAAAGAQLGPEAAFNKLLMTRTEQNLFNLLRETDGARIALPADTPEEVLQQQEYLFSRIVTVYGGTQQMQLITVARHILGLHDG
ncbi:acyl-CoA dehydrogenase family protein [Trujillonella endophytica]|uniref:Acyl-CoA dehydrogenase n=1 Tax=Trujillonella endophytica TaxID=673521 RepID=A0A1H8Q698_9ACTN|nr:acyl-CoA dehydrogenase family protein [Trujillella endophytica]SEO49491.1 Acyl-CoA dehydrogenase [Trujillella endophytica]